MFNQEYVTKLEDTRRLCRKRLEAKGLTVTNCTEQIGLSISLTEFGLSTIYATLTQEEIEYIVDNEIEL